MNRQKLEKRVIQIAEQVLHQQHYVSCIDVLLGLGYLHMSQVLDWRKGKIPTLEQVIQANLNKLSFAMKSFRQWSKQKGLKASETRYMARTRGPKKYLQFSKSGDPHIELAYRTHYISPLLTDKKREKLKEKLEKPLEHVIFQIIKSSVCEQCGKELSKGAFLYKAQDKAQCLKCSNFDSLVLLPAGNAKLTRLAKQYSQVYAVVVRFSRARKRYERQGLLVEGSALQKAEDELA